MDSIQWIAITLSSFAIIGVLYVYYTRILLYCIQSNHEIEPTSSV